METGRRESLPGGSARDSPVVLGEDENFKECWRVACVPAPSQQPCFTQGRIRSCYNRMQTTCNSYFNFGLWPHIARCFVLLLQTYSRDFFAIANCATPTLRSLAAPKNLISSLSDSRILRTRIRTYVPRRGAEVILSRKGVPPRVPLGAPYGREANFPDLGEETFSICIL